MYYFPLAFHENGGCLEDFWSLYSVWGFCFYTYTYIYTYRAVNTYIERLKKKSKHYIQLVKGFCLTIKITTGSNNLSLFRPFCE